MPELPEVETVRRGLEPLVGNCTIDKIEFSDKTLRVQAKKHEVASIKQQRIHRISRRAKYLVIELDDCLLLSHLGMTGSWRIECERRKHDHVRIFLTDGRVLTYCDPRRFGMFEVGTKGMFEKEVRFLDLGPDPTTEESFDGDYLFSKIRNSKSPIKTLIMNQNIVVGVGNIYASEALFLAGIHPMYLGIQMTKSLSEKLANSIYEVLIDAIACGGTTISDFRQAGGSSGYFQNLLLVYGRAGHDCVFCETVIESQVIVGRNSFWCPSCQKL